MSPFAALPLATRIALVVCTVVAAALAIRVEVAWRADQATRERALVAYGRATAERVAQDVERGNVPAVAGHAPGPPGPGTIGRVDGIHLVDRRGLVTWSDPPGRVGVVLPPPPIPLAATAGETWVGRVRSDGAWAGLTEGGTRLLACAPLPAPKGSRGAGLRRRGGRAGAAAAEATGPPRVVVVGWDLSLEAAALRERHARDHASGLLFALLLGIALWAAMRRLVSRPLEELSRVAARRDLLAGDLAGLAGRDDEIGALARALGRAQSRLEDVRREGAERAARLAGAVDATADGVVLATRRDDGWIVDHVNARFAALCGRPPSSLEGRPVLDGLRSFAERIVEGAAVERWIAHALDHPEFEGQRSGALLAPPGDGDAGGERILLDNCRRQMAAFTRTRAGRPTQRSIFPSAVAPPNR
jgi:PAS domain-containing protein